MDAIKTFDNASIEGKQDMFEEAHNGWVKSNAALIERDNRIAELEASLADAREANALAANVIKESQRDVDVIRELRTQLAQAETATTASARMASKQAAKVSILRAAAMKASSRDDEYAKLRNFTACGCRWCETMRPALEATK